MARLSASDRKSEPSSDFGLPAERKYPMPDRAHAANAKARASQQRKRGNLTAAQEAKIDAKANKILGESGGSPKVGNSDDEHRHAHDRFAHGATRDHAPRYGS